MHTDLITLRCDECDRKMVKVQRIYKGRRYCAICYARVFKRRICPKCGNSARLPENDPVAVCRKCENDRPCIRCGKVSYAIGKITIYGPVCNACSPYFRKSEPCEVCGVLSSRLTRSSRLGHNRQICPKCARADYGTCQACTRYRWLLENPAGQMVCKTCFEEGEVVCSMCQELMPAGYGSQCQHCYWRNLLEKRIHMDCAAFSLPKMATHFEAFSYWLMERVGEHKAALTINRYLPFFMEVERNWTDFPKFTAILMHFGTAKLRRFLLPMRWMEATGIVVPDVAAKVNDSHNRSIIATLDKFAKGTREHEILEGYYGTLSNDMRKGKVSLRSVRLALSPAGALLRKAGEMGRTLPDQNVLKAYLDKVPGQRAAVSRFVRYLREEHCVNIFLPKLDPVRIKRLRKKELEVELLALMRESIDSIDFKQRWLSVSLAYYHGLDRSIGLIAKDSDILHAEGGLVVIWRNNHYWVPEKPGR